ncbi:FtsX-like permease family protein [Kutzneria kofuensis]|uniref:MFS family permease n=1 Tax=Kutzneria kofuensis TaxID=103725 RepID=A0A7W9KMD4_9PSEU|nr:FtsX-like permease family protein [Kutzneria kofuensis]MBB5895196.1 MFS family permease [Kutzneria kofuensis]
MSVFRIALAVLRNDSRSRVSTALVTVGVALGVSLVLWLASAPHALQQRADRIAWRSTYNTVSQNDGRAQLVLSMNQDQFGGKLIHRFDVTRAHVGGYVSLAPGIREFPEPGQVLLSPALAELVRTTPPEKLGDRFPGQVVDLIGEQALEYPDELVAIVGHEPGTISGYALTGFGGNAGYAADNSDMLYLLTRIGMVVLIVPCLVLVASAARLTATRRERRLAALRLAGATPAQVIAMAAVETVIGAVLGSVIAVVAAEPLSHLTALIPWGGGTWMPGDFTSGPLFVGFVAVLAPVLVVAAAVLGLRRVVDRPLMAAEEKSRRKISPARLLGLVMAGGVFVLGVSIATSGYGGQERFTVVLVGLGAVGVALVLAGPVVTALVGRYFVARWRKPSTLLAGRRLLGDPVASFRAAAGVVVAVFAGSMALTMLPALENDMPTFSGPWRDSAIVTTSVGQHADPVAELRAEMARRALPAQVVPMVTGYLVSTSDQEQRSSSAVIAPCKEVASVLSGLSAGDCVEGPAVYIPRGYADAVKDVKFERDARGPNETRKTEPLPATVPVHTVSDYPQLIVIDPAVFPDLAAKPTGVAVTSTPSNRDAVYTALVRVLPDVRVSDNVREVQQDDSLMGDLRRATAIGLALMALLSGASAAVAAAGSVIDRRRTFGALIAAGTPVRVLARALRREVVLPVLVATLGSCLAGMLVGLGLLSVAHSISGHAEALLNLWILAPAAAGFVVALAAAAACGPVLRTFSARDYAAE